MKYILIIIIFLSSCIRQDKTTNQKVAEVDTLIEQSIKLADSSIVVLHLADKKTQIIVQQTIEKFENLENANANLRGEIGKLKKVQTKTVVIRDTIYITEKKNFWGKKKVKVDSTQSVITADSSLNEN